MEQANGVTVDFALIAQTADVSVHGLLSLQNGGMNRLTIGSLSQQLPLVFVARVRDQNAETPVMYTCRIVVEPPVSEGDSSYGDTRGYIFTREGSFLVLPVTVQVGYPGEYVLRLFAYRGNAASNEYGDFDSSSWPMIAEAQLFIQ